MSTNLDQTSLLCPSFYRLIEPRQTAGVNVYSPGQLILAHCTYAEVEPYILDVTGYDMKDPKNTSFTGKRLSAGTGVGTHFPIKELQLAADEFYYVVRGKYRPCLVVQSVVADWGNQLHPQPYVLVAPGFTFKPRHDTTYRYRVVSMEFPHLFFLPKQSNGFTDDTIIRFEHMQAVPIRGVRPAFSGQKWCALSDEAFLLFEHQLLKFTSGRILDNETEETISDYRQLIQDTFLQ